MPARRCLLGLALVLHEVDCAQLVTCGNGTNVYIWQLLSILLLKLQEHHFDTAPAGLHALLLPNNVDLAVDDLHAECPAA